MTTSLWWVRDDLGGTSPAALAAATDGDCVTCFVVDPALHGVTGTPRGTLLFELLDELSVARSGLPATRVRSDASGVPFLDAHVPADGRVLLLEGDPRVVVSGLARAIGAERVHVEAAFTPFARTRDHQVRDALEAHRGELIEHPGRYLVAPGTLRSATGGRIRGFSNFYRRWEEIAAAVSAPGDAGVTRVPTRATAASDRWADWAPSGLASYANRRDLPASDGTSQLSIPIRFGLVDRRRVAADARAAGATAFLRELAFREFFADLLWHHPDAAVRSIDSRFDTLGRTGPAAEAAFRRFTLGQTGFPLVDAGVRQLRATGWMHNRVRMVVASFLVKDLHLPWQWGASFFMRHLLDGDVASNSGNWQWVAGSAPDAAPFFRVMNPVLQSERFDPDGTYLRTWLPELAAVTGDAVHDPTRRLRVVPDGYPLAMLDHAEERKVALERYRAL
jgi:deoxyribodipyrimidine photo-lyase